MGSGSAYQAAPGSLHKGMRLHKGLRRCLAAVLVALALAVASAGCEFPHIKPPAVREKIHNFNNSDLNNMRKHAPGGDSPTCSGDQGDPWYCNDDG